MTTTEQHVLRVMAAKRTAIRALQAARGVNRAAMAALFPEPKMNGEGFAYFHWRRTRYSHCDIRTNSCRTCETNWAQGWRK